jgi:hypothetical protein
MLKFTGGFYDTCERQAVKRAELPKQHQNESSRAVWKADTLRCPIADRGSSYERTPQIGRQAHNSRSSARPREHEKE